MALGLEFKFCSVGLGKDAGATASTDWIAFLDDPKAGAVAVAAAMLMAVMRALTTTPAGSLATLLRRAG